MPGGFRVLGASVNVDHQLDAHSLVRLEVRRLQASDKIYPLKGDNRSHDTFVVGSLGVGF